MENLKIIELDNKTALNKVEGGFPYKWDLNIYRGCNHACKYCYAIYSHSYLNDANYFETIYYKKNILSCLEKELSNPKRKIEVVNIGGVCDSYQKVEEKLKIMPEVLKILIKYKTPIIISTKSDLILRDIDLINELSKTTYVNIAFTITTVDEDIRKWLEPNTSLPIARFKAAKKIKKETNASVGIHIMPIIAHVNDNPYSLNKIYEMASKINANYVLPSTIHLVGQTRKYFLDELKKYDYNKYKKFTETFYDKDLKKAYKIKLYTYINTLKKKHNVSGDYMKGIKEITSKQLSFDV